MSGERLTRRQFLKLTAAGAAGVLGGGALALGAKKGTEVVGAAAAGIEAFLERGIKVVRKGSGATPTNTLEPKGTPIPKVPPTGTNTPTPRPTRTLEPTHTPTPEVTGSYEDLTQIENFSEWQKAVFEMIYVPVPNGVTLYNDETQTMGALDLEFQEIVPIFGRDPETGRLTNIVQGFSVTREGPAWTEGHEIPWFYMKNPTGSMQYGWMHKYEDRQDMGLTESECNQLGYAERNAGAGIPGLFEGPVEGLSFYFNQSEGLGKLVNQTVKQRK